MTDDYTVTFSKALIDSGALGSVQIVFRGPDDRPASQPPGATSASSGGVECGTSPEHPHPHCYHAHVRVYAASSVLSAEPAYYSCVNPTAHVHERGKFYVVTKGTQPGIYYCWCDNSTTLRDYCADAWLGLALSSRAKASPGCPRMFRRTVRRKQAMYKLASSGVRSMTQVIFATGFPVVGASFVIS